MSFLLPIDKSLAIAHLPSKGRSIDSVAENQQVDPADRRKGVKSYPVFSLKSRDP
jgi:hypothetical protein